MKKTKILLVVSLLCTHCFCFGGCSTAKITSKVFDETGKPINDAQVYASWEIPKTRNPWDGSKIVDRSGETNHAGEYTFSNLGDFKIWLSARMPGYYEARRKYTFTSADEKLEKPWHPTITLVLRKIENPIPMYAKRFFDKNFPFTNAEYDLVKGDFLPPHGKGENADCIFKFEFEDEGEKWEIGYTRRDSFSITFLGDFNGIVPVKETDVFPESIFVWPRFAYEDSYVTQTVSYGKQYSRLANPKDKRGKIAKDVETHTPNADRFFFRIRSEKHLDGTFKSAYYGKFIFPKIEIVALKENPEIRYTIKDFTYYINPTRNDRNMEFDPNENLMYPKYKVPGENRWKIPNTAYTPGEVGVGAP